MADDKMADDNDGQDACLYGWSSPNAGPVEACPTPLAVLALVGALSGGLLATPSTGEAPNGVASAVHPIQPHLETIHDIL